MLSILLTLAALVGPPWISIEYPANPLDQSTRNAYLLVHSFHHQTEMQQAITGEAMTWENGQKRTVTLRFEETSRAGVYKLNKQWTDGTPWVLRITVGAHGGEAGGATALVSVDRQGGVAKVVVPSEPYRDFRVPRTPTEGEIATAFQVAGGAALAQNR